MTNYIEIRQLKIMARHGVHDEEKFKPQPFLFDVKMDVDFSAAGDDIEATVSYSDAMKLINKYVLGHCFNLIETLATELTKLLLRSFEQIRKVRVTVSKPQAPVPLDFETVCVTEERGWVTAYVALGSNLGDRQAYLEGAVRFLESRKGIRIKKVSSFIETEPYGGVADCPFLNGAMEIETYLTPFELLDVLQEGEQLGGRVREEHWGNRTLDLDLLLYGEEKIETERLTVPHKEMVKRDFVLRPLAQIAPFAWIPTVHRTVEEALGYLPMPLA
ncbi:MAG: 2-amino-4-hydroxy-6-hydroxymethyldihydropteridine diphosphokinase [Christensenellaceae bacterium]